MSRTFTSKMSTAAMLHGSVPAGESKRNSGVEKPLRNVFENQGAQCLQKLLRGKESRAT